MKWEELSKSVKCAVTGLTAAAALCVLAVGFDHTYVRASRVDLLASNQQEQQQQIYNMQLSMNYNSFVTQLRNLENAYRGKPIPPEVHNQMAWLRNEIRKLELQMRKGN